MKYCIHSQSICAGLIFRRETHEKNDLDSDSLRHSHVRVDCIRSGGRGQRFRACYRSIAASDGRSDRPRQRRRHILQCHEHRFRRRPGNRYRQYDHRTKRHAGSDVGGDGRRLALCLGRRVSCSRRQRAYDRPRFCRSRGLDHLDRLRRHGDDLLRRWQRRLCRAGWCIPFLLRRRRQ